MIDVFLCTITGSDFLREAMADLCLRRWMQISGVNLIEINEDILECSPLEFQRQRRIFADEHAKSSIYVVADADYLLPSDFDIQACVNVMLKHESFAILSVMPSNCLINPWTPEVYVVDETAEVMEHHSVGGVRFCRKHVVTNWIPMQPGFPGYDAIQCEQIRQENRRSGFFKNHSALHLGEGFSSVWTPENMAAIK